MTEITLFVWKLVAIVVGLGVIGFLIFRWLYEPIRDWRRHRKQEQDWYRKWNDAEKDLQTFRRFYDDVCHITGKHESKDPWVSQAMNMADIRTDLKRKYGKLSALELQAYSSSQ